MSIIKQILILLLIVAVGGGGYYGYQHAYGDVSPLGGAADKSKRGRQGGDRVEVMAVKLDTVRDAVEAVGTTRATQAIEVVTLASGRVMELVAKPGQEVKKGDPIILLDDDIEKANLAEAKAKLLKAQSFLDRSKTLRESKFTSQASLDQVRADAASAAAEVGRAERRLADRVIRAAFSGRVGLNKVEVGARVDTNTVLTTLDDVSKVEIEFQLAEVVFGRVRHGMRVLAEAVAFPGRVFEGKIENVDTRIDRSSRTFLVRAAIPNPDRELPAGMFMRLSMIFDERQALVVSEEAIVAEGADALVFAVVNGKASRRKVTVGLRRPGTVELTDGVKAGDLVVTRGLERLRDGKRVQIVSGLTEQSALHDKVNDASSGALLSAGNAEKTALFEVEGAVSVIKQGGGQVVWRLKDGKEIEVLVSGQQTQVIVDGKKASASSIKVGMLCKATASREGDVAKTIECKQKSGA